MDIKVTQAGRAAIVKLEGRMDAESCGELDRACGKARALGVLHIVADLSGLTYISSAGIGAFVRIAGELRDSGGEMVLTEPHGLVRDVFELTHVIRIFRVFESLGAAVASLA